MDLDALEYQVEQVNRKLALTEAGSKPHAALLALRTELHDLISLTAARHAKKGKNQQTGAGIDTKGTENVDINKGTRHSHKETENVDTDKGTESVDAKKHMEADTNKDTESANSNKGTNIADDTENTRHIETTGDTETTGDSENTRSMESAPSDPGFAAGDTVMAKYAGNGKMYPAKVTLVSGPASARMYTVVFYGYTSIEIIDARDVRGVSPGEQRFVESRMKRGSSTAAESAKRHKKAARREQVFRERAAIQDAHKANWQAFASKKKDKPRPNVLG